MQASDTLLTQARAYRGRPILSAPDGILRPVIRRALPVLVGLVAACCAGLGAQEAPPDGGPTMLVSGSASLVVEGREESIPVLETERGPLFPLQALVVQGRPTLQSLVEGSLPLEGLVSQCTEGPGAGLPEPREGPAP